MPTQEEHQSPPSMRAHLTCAAILVGAAIVFFSPVLLHAHWGTFDDPSLILQSSRRLMDDPSTITYILAAQLRMGIFYWVTVLWRLFPENPTGYFATNCLLISGALVLMYCTCFKLTKDLRISGLCASAVLASPSLFEVIYTLDKQEVYFPFLFSTVILTHILSIDCKRRFLPLLATASALCSTACYLSKETGVILAFFSASFTTISLIFSKRTRTKVAFSAGIMLIATVAPLLILKFICFPTTSDKYVVLTFDIQKLFAKTWQYAVVVPDFFLELAFSVSCGIAFALNKAFEKRNLEWSSFSALLISSVAATVALISFDTFAGVLLYIWLPIYFLALPCLAYSISNLPMALGLIGKNVRNSFIAILLLLMISQLPTRFLQAQFQFSFDSMTSELAQKLTDLAASTSAPTVCAMPTYSVGETEIPEQIETHVRSRLQKRYYETKSEQTTEQKFTMLNYLSPDCENTHVAGDPPNIYRLTQFRGKELSYKNECPPNYVGWTGFQILNGASPFQEWVKRPYGKGDLLIVPYGEAAPDTILYRGVGTFAHPWKLKTLNFPQLKLEDVGHVERKLYNLLGHRQTIGWRILRVTQAEPAALETSTDGWLKPNGKVFYKRPVNQKSLRIISKQPAPQALVVHQIVPKMQTTAGDDVLVPEVNENTTTVVVPLSDKPESGVLQIRALNGDQRLHVDALDYSESADERPAPFLSKTADNWILNNALIVYSPDQTGKVLKIVTSEPSAPLTVTNKSKSITAPMAQGVARITLADGKQLNNKLLYLQLSSKNPITSAKDKRELLIHCDRYQIDQ